MTALLKPCAMVGLLLCNVTMASANESTLPLIFEDFTSETAQNWTFVTDGVMGGVSDGQAQLENGAMRLTGEVSTKNNGGFIQVRYRFDGGWPADAEGLTVSARGNGESYFIFLRTPGLNRVYYSYRASFTALPDWSETSLAFARFEPSHKDMPIRFDPAQVNSVGIVAYGRDFSADVAVRRLTLY